MHRTAVLLLAVGHSGMCSLLCPSFSKGLELPKVGSKSCLVPVMAGEEGKSLSFFLWRAAVAAPILPASAEGTASLSFSPSQHPSSSHQPSASLSLPGVDAAFKQGVPSFNFTSIT